MGDFKLLPRSWWTSTPKGFPRLSARRLDQEKVRTLVPHYPAAGDVSYADPTPEQTQNRLRNWRNLHVNTHGWADLGYPFWIDQAGRVGIGAGWTHAAAHASQNNFVSLGVLFIVGNNERPSKDARRAFRRLGRWLRENYFPNLVAVMDHGRLPGEATSCAGRPIRADVNAGNLSITGSESSSSSGGSSSSGSSSSTSVAQLAREVIDGQHGVGAERQSNLGDQYQAVQAEVNRILSGNATQASDSSSGGSVTAVARRVINGEFGNGATRSSRLRSAGHDPDAVQSEVNRLLGAGGGGSGDRIARLAREVIDGQHGDGDARRRSLGSDYEAVQAEVNRQFS